ncbi:hypothetical protein GUITHDRAFT_117895 [Guillardia theta CCMP2712]|uniref:Protein kinase domain-containing protein n=1 Tax=Guillardia theta (strain CCMP2712) TaxID=905079 RepID=L1IJJ0_GUITC|nr:hypothetical protein GUITHDRAFT_117895 [Guillardia theta CCMP2712]EKX35980.1 hypothetical protein GUITHDRAFT_117895 [Guillardia theta CCMP2712]|eukprot:XP_005822960.1 hypothetical protein GUITHDRAFT_117895 [Guillardia theta CCMP2712]
MSGQGASGFAGLPLAVEVDYSLDDIIGEGSFAQVFRAWDSGGGMVALKMVRPEDHFDDLPFDRTESDEQEGDDEFSYSLVLQSLQDELKSFQTVGRHPSIVEIVAASEVGDMVVMEMAEIDLYQYIHRHSKFLTLDLIQSWSAQILHGIDHIHKSQIVHMDMKTSNILIRCDGSVCICDFGLACRVEGHKEVKKELVTLWYRPPELIMGCTKYSNSVDMWGLGCIVLEMLLGRPAFQGRNDARCTCTVSRHWNFNSDQLMQIFTLLGTPEEHEYLQSMSCYRHFNFWPIFPRKLEQSIQASLLVIGGRKNASAVLCEVEAWMQLLTSCLQFNPERRVSARQTLACRIFSSVPQADESDDSPKEEGSRNLCARLSGMPRRSSHGGSRFQTSACLQAQVPSASPNQNV